MLRTDQQRYPPDKTNVVRLSRSGTPKAEMTLGIVTLGNYSATYFALPLRSLSSTQAAFVVETSVASENNRNLVLA